MEKIDVLICLKRWKKDKEYQKNYREAKKCQHIIINNFFNYDIIINKIGFYLWFDKVCYVAGYD